MRFLVLSALLGFMVGCASAPQEEQREPASAKSACEIQKHAKKDWYRLMVHDKPAFSSWYTQDQAQKHFSMYEKKGKCQ